MLLGLCPLGLRFRFTMAAYLSPTLRSRSARLLDRRDSTRAPRAQAMTDTEAPGAPNESERTPAHVFIWSKLSHLMSQVAEKYDEVTGYKEKVEGMIKEMKIDDDVKDAMKNMTEGFGKVVPEELKGVLEDFDLVSVTLSPRHVLVQLLTSNPASIRVSQDSVTDKLGEIVPVVGGIFKMVKEVDDSEKKVDKLLAQVQRATDMICYLLSKRGSSDDTVQCQRHLPSLSTRYNGRLPLSGWQIDTSITRLQNVLQKVETTLSVHKSGNALKKWLSAKGTMTECADLTTEVKDGLDELRTVSNA